MTWNHRAEKLRDTTLYVFGAYHSTHATYDPATGHVSPEVDVCTDLVCVQTRDALAADRDAA
jgi:hypothetical protein